MYKPALRASSAFMYLARFFSLFTQIRVSPSPSFQMVVVVVLAIVYRHAFSGFYVCHPRWRWCGGGAAVVAVAFGCLRRNFMLDVIPCVGGPPVPNNQLFNWFRSKEINRGCLCTTDYSGKTGRCDRK
ncbi:hypothetical protein L1987_78564 [Smallanthus sonchifolius]|uniref:Uncharacterized protein n=1 Tax=Smallanthus sonchifolius TaxID=185202 RepID=A0ACB8ZCQ8_9ASTR|nr:hypothetical protein L1987_78564 [Smallanthus sonchifolius]